MLGQLGNRVQHALRAFTPRDQKAVKTAADTLRPNPAIDTGRAITELAVGEALVSLLDEKGSPTVTERAWIVPPASRIGPITDAAARGDPRRRTSRCTAQYEQTVDRESAYEKLKANREDRAAGAAATAGPAAGEPAGTGRATGTDRRGRRAVLGSSVSIAPRRRRLRRCPGGNRPWAGRRRAPGFPRAEPGRRRPAADQGLTGALSDFLFGHTGPRGGHYDGALASAGKSAARSVGSGIGRAILRGALGRFCRVGSRDRSRSSESVARRWATRVHRQCADS